MFLIQISIARYDPVGPDRPVRDTQAPRVQGAIAQ